MGGDYLLCGWRLASELELPELLHWQGGERSPDVLFQLGAIPPPTGEVVFTLPHHQVYADGSYLLTMAGVARYWVTGGHRVVVEVSEGGDLHDVRIFLLSSVLAVLCYQRRLFPLHAAAVEINGGAVILAGGSYSGKSTLAMALVQRGHGLISDDITVIDDNGTSPPAVLATFPNIKLNLDALKKLDLDATRLQLNRPGRSRWVVPVGGGSSSSPLPILAIYHLVQSKREHSLQVETLSVFDAVALLDGLAARQVVGQAIASKEWLFQSAARLVQSWPIRQVTFFAGNPICHPQPVAAWLESNFLAGAEP